VTSKGDSQKSMTPVGTATSVLAALRARMRDRATSSPLSASSVPGVPRAAVALVLRIGDTGLEILLIKRAERTDDPWSGHIALPGGREEPSDASLEATAIRETLEETGIDLARDGEILGALEDLQPQSMPRAILVRPYVAVLRTDAPLVLSDEVAEAFWVAVDRVTAPDAVIESVVHVRGLARRVPSFRHGEHVVWGMTERILQQLRAALTDPTFP
jgi:8-oxo-dGTP pyrophosphatase MutT (NUDIX family)